MSRSLGTTLLAWITSFAASAAPGGEVPLPGRTVLDAPPPPSTAGPAPTAATPVSVRVPVTRDTWFSNVGAEADGNNGGATRLKFKSHQEMSLIDVDAAPLRGRVVRSAALHLRLAAEPRLLRVTVGGFGAEWVEGTASGYAPQAGSSTHNRRRHPDVPWTVLGSDLSAVILGQGGTTWRMADATPPDSQGWQQVAVDPTVLAARVAGVSHGLFLFDDTGSEWSRQGETFTPRPMPNRFVHSRESGTGDAPYLTVVLGPEDKVPPIAPGEFEADPADLPAGEAWVSWVTPRDEGPAGTIGFFVRVGGEEVPRYLIPLAGKAGDRVKMHLRDLGLAPGAEIPLAVRAVDGAGNLGPGSGMTVRVSRRVAAPLPGADPEPFRRRGPLPKLGGAEVAVVDELDKVQPVTGATIPPQPDGYLEANHLWEAPSRRVRLHAARNEFVGFQVLVRGGVQGVRPTLTFERAGASGIKAEFGRYRHVATREGPLPDPIVPMDGPLDVPSADEAIAGQRIASLYCELYVPHEAESGVHEGTLTLVAGKETLALDVSLTVWDFTMPDVLSFLPEMNCYGLPADEREYYRLAHRHRTVLNRVPYTQNGIVSEGCAPAWDGEALDWSAWDRRFGPYFDGSAFADLPRKGVPLEAFYLPLHENWPVPVEGHYNNDYWADRAFAARYRRDFVEVSRQVAEHVNAKGWDETLFQFFLNGKNDFKVRGWSRASSPWLLDEPASFQDFWALRYFGVAFHEGVRQAPGNAKLVFRADISRPQWQRDALDGLLDYNVVGGAMRTHPRLVFDRKADDGSLVVEYASSNAIEEANVQPVGWCLDSWALGSDGVLPWQTVGTADSWEKADTLALFYPGRGGKETGPVPSIRLKAYRRGQQDVEYLTLLAQVSREPRWAIGRRVREALRLAGERKGTGLAVGEDAGQIYFARLTPEALWALRVRVGMVLSEARPAPTRRLVDLRTPPRDPSRLAPRHAATAEPPANEDRRPDAVGSGVVKTLQGRSVVRDALIDPDRPDLKLGAFDRDNAVRKGATHSVFLVRFDLEGLGLPAGAKVGRATVGFSVWDPSSQGRTKVCAFAMTTPWEEAGATYRQAADGRPWKGGHAFSLGVDTGPVGSPSIIKPDAGADTADPPVDYRLDVTDAVQAWLDGRAPNFGLAIAPVSDRTIDDGATTRFQIYASESSRTAATPRLTLHVQP